MKQLPAKDEAESGAPEQDTRKDDSGVFQGGVKSMDKTASSSENTNRQSRLAREIIVLTGFHAIRFQVRAAERNSLTSLEASLEPRSLYKETSRRKLRRPSATAPVISI